MSRAAIVAILATFKVKGNELTVSQIAKETHLVNSNVSEWMNALKQGGLATYVERSQKGKSSGTNTKYWSLTL